MLTATATRTAARQLLRAVARMEAERRAGPTLRRLRQDPGRILGEAGYPPDPWQTSLLRSTSDRILMLISRQGGKSLTAAALALREALLHPPALVLLLSPTLRQSGELFRDKVRRLYNGLGWPVAAVQETQLTMELANGSRIVALPGDEEMIRGYSGVRLLICDEAARIPDVLYYSVRPMLAVSHGKLACLSTPWGKRGWFFEEWRGAGPWHRVRVPATDCPRISQEFLAEERASLGDYFWSQEYMLEFRDTMDSFFRQEDIDAMFDNTLTPLLLE